MTWGSGGSGRTGSGLVGGYWEGAGDLRQVEGLGGVEAEFLVGMAGNYALTGFYADFAYSDRDL